MPVTDRFRLDGHVTVVTGAAAGIGRAIALTFADAGSAVVVTDIKHEGAEAVAEEIRAHGGRAIGMECNVTREDHLAAVVAAALEAFGKVTVLVNNAGGGGPKPFDMPMSDFEWAFQLNVFAMFRFMQMVAPHMEAAGGGAILNISSIVALVGSYPAQIAYTASKGGVLSMSREMAVGLARRGIRVNAICPGWTATEMAMGLMRDDAAFELRRLHIPMGRMGLPAEIAATAAFLVSDEASYITGQSFPVDGGLTGAFLTPPDR